MAGAALYEKDFFRWTEEQATALRQAARAGANLPLDWENLAEEIESLGISQKHELRSRLATILEHLLKLEHSPAADPRSGWIETIGRERVNIERVLDDSPSLRRQVAQMIEKESPKIARLVSGILFGYGETAAKLPAPAYTEDEVLGEWFPDPPNRRPGPPRGRGARSG